MNLKPGRLIAAALLLALPFAGTRPVSAAAGLCVAPGGAHGCFSSINAAIAAATPGATIRISEGRYFENVAVNKSVTLAGAGDDVVIMPAVSSPNPCEGGSLCGGAASSIVLVQADNVTIHDLTLDGDNPHLTSGIVRDYADLDARNGIIVDYNYGNGVFNNLTVYNVTVKNVYLRGIYASTGGTFNFHDNTVTNVQGDGNSIAMFNWVGSGRMVHNRVSKANDAISANHSSGTQFLNNEIRESGSGVHTDNAGDGGGSGDVIQGNRVTDGMAGGAYGIFVFVPYVPVTVTGNDVSGVDLGLAAFGGAFGAPTVTTTFTDNDVTGHHVAGSVGVLVTTDTLGYGETDVKAIFKRNNVSDFENGVVIQAGAGLAVAVNASCNAVLHSSAQGVVAGGLALDTWHLGLPSAGGGLQDITFSQNTINGKNVGMENRGAGSINAANNWWGCPAGPTGHGCDTVVGSGSVTFTPWLTKPASCARGGDKGDDK